MYTFKPLFWISAFLFIACLSYVAFIPKQYDFVAITIPYSIAFGIYIFFISFQLNSRHHFAFLISIGILIRFILIFSFPHLSDDIYRFLWDGNFTINGINPYTILPSEYIQHPTISANNLDLYTHLNSPNYFTIYPSFAQLIYAFCAWLSFSLINAFSFWLKLILFFFEIGTIYLVYRLLKKWRLPVSNTLFYALNPLIIIEVMGNVHFEGVMIFFLGLFLLFITHYQSFFSPLIAISLSIASKLLPLMFIPFLFRFLGIKRFLQFCIGLALILLLLLTPIWFGLASGNFSQSIDLYFQKFEYNASIYYVFRWIGNQIYGYNMISKIGPSLAILLVNIILYFGWIQKKYFPVSQLVLLYLFSFTLYLFLATTVHPWYLTTLIFLSCFTVYRYPIIWSGLIYLSYINYSYTPYHENLSIIFIEYTILLMYIVWELINTSNKKAY